MEIDFVREQIEIIMAQVPPEDIEALKVISDAVLARIEELSNDEDRPEEAVEDTAQASEGQSCGQEEATSTED